MKKHTKRVLAILLMISLCLSGIGPIHALAEETEGSADSEKPAITTLVKSYSHEDIQAVGGIEAYSNLYYGTSKKVKADLSNSLALANSLNFSNQTSFSKVPTGFSKTGLLSWGKYPGLNMDILQKYGFTGKGAVVAYVDQPVKVKDNEQYKNANVHYKNNSSESASMHGPAVLGLLVGKDIGTAPDAEVYYYAHATNQKYLAECLYQIIEKNKKLPKSKKITMVGFSNNIHYTEKYAEDLEKAVKDCEDAGIMVWFCGEYSAASFIPNSDRNNFENVTVDARYGFWSSDRLVYVPAGGRTTAYQEGNKSYIYWSSGGLSWTMPYMLGLYGIVKQIDPSLTKEEIRTLVVETAYTNSAGLRIVDPVEFVCTVLDKVGRTSTAKKMRAEVKARQSYTYAILNTATLSEEDVDCISQYLSSITDSSVLTVDASAYKNVEELYKALVADHKERGGKVAGIQIFGTPTSVPAFAVSYKVQLEKGVDDFGTLLTDFFYSNFNNDAGILDESYSVYDQFKNNLKVDLVPQWPVVRLPLEKGEFKTYFSNYNAFATKTALKKRTLVNFSNPIFPSKQHTDDMGQFLQRMTGTYKMNLTYRLYGNLDGQYPVSTKVLGNFTAVNLKKENKKGNLEFVINSHGQQNNIDQAIFVNNEEQRKSLINSGNINNILSSNYYYLDLWTCLNGCDMSDNLVTTALNGKCIGAFAATTIISNNGVDNKASVSKMKKSNFYYFYYTYFKALSGGSSRSTAFYKAQKAYANALLTESKKKIDYGANYQFNLYNLLCYENFGVISSNPVVSSLYKISNTVEISDENNMESGSDGAWVVENAELTDGNPIGAVSAIAEFMEETTSAVKVKSIRYQKLDNGYMRFMIELDLNEPRTLFAFDPPNGNTFAYHVAMLEKGNPVVEVDIPESKLKLVDVITFGLSKNDFFADFFYFSTSFIK